jgi:hypothetical protein
LFEEIEKLKRVNVIGVIVTSTNNRIDALSRCLYQLNQRDSHPKEETGVIRSKEFIDILEK